MRGSPTPGAHASGLASCNFHTPLSRGGTAATTNFNQQVTRETAALPPSYTCVRTEKKTSHDVQEAAARIWREGCCLLLLRGRPRVSVDVFCVAACRALHAPLYRVFF